MTRLARTREIDYPESDGRPMGETDLHRWWMIYIHQLLEHRYRGQDVYVGSDLLLFYVEGDPKKFVVPDNFVVLDCKPGFRRSFKIWTEGRVPNVIFEVTSRKTRKQDETLKPQVYAQIGVRELFLYDPTLDYLTTALQGYRMEGGRYERLEPTVPGTLESTELGLLLRLDRERLVIQDAASGLPLLTKAEAEEARAEAETARAEAERERAERAENRATALELELDRLRQQLQKLPHPSRMRRPGRRGNQIPIHVSIIKPLARPHKLPARQLHLRRARRISTQLPPAQDARSRQKLRTMTNRG